MRNNWLWFVGDSTWVCLLTLRGLGVLCAGLGSEVPPGNFDRIPKMATQWGVALAGVVAWRVAVSPLSSSRSASGSERGRHRDSITEPATGARLLIASAPGGEDKKRKKKNREATGSDSTTGPSPRPLALSPATKTSTRPYIMDPVHGPSDPDQRHRAAVAASSSTPGGHTAMYRCWTQGLHSIAQ